MNTVVNKGVYPNGLFGGGVHCLCEFGPQGFRGDELFGPYHCDASNTGDVAIADTENHRIQIFQSTGFTSIFPPFGGLGFGDGQLNQPKSVKYSSIPGTNLAVADTGNRRVCLLRINFKLGKLEHVRSFGQTQFQEPTDLAIDRRNGNVIVVDTALSQVLIMNQYGQYQGCLEQRDFNFHRPTSVAVTHDGKSDIYVSDTGNHCIRRFTCNGDYLGILGKLGTAEGEFNNPRGITLDRQGYLYVADEGNNRVQMFTPDLKYVTTIVSGIYLPKGVAAGTNLIVTTGDQENFVKVFSS